MLRKVINPEIKSFEKKIEIKDNIFINIKVISHSKYSGRRALYIHGGGIYGDHTLAVRPAEYLISKDIFSSIILPDRRGAGKSSPLAGPNTIKEQSEEMRLLLNALEINERITVIGSSLGGLVSLYLAGIDNRIERVILIGSSPTLLNASFTFKFLGETGILKGLLKLLVWFYAGRYPPTYINQDDFYDLQDLKEYTKMAIKVLSHFDRNELYSIFFKIDSLFEKQNCFLPSNIKLDIPVLQVIGEKDEFWGKDIPDIYIKNFPLLNRSVIPKAVHKDVILKADLFHNEIIKYMEKK